MHVYFFFRIDFVGDCFTNTIQFMKFSTKDQDNDAFDGHCAVAYNSGWWHNNCHCANPNGLFGQGMTYRHWHTQTYFLKSTKLMVRRNVQQNREALLQVHESVEVPFNPDYWKNLKRKLIDCLCKYWFLKFIKLLFKTLFGYAVWSPFFYSRYMAEYYRYDVKPHIIHQSITTVFTWFNQVTLLTDKTFALPNHGHLFYEVSMFSLPFVIINVVLLLVYVIKFYVFQ